MFIAKVIRAKEGRWSKGALDYISKNQLGPSSGIEFGYITIRNESTFTEFESQFETNIESVKKAYAIFTSEELQRSTSFLLLHLAPTLVYGANLGKEDGLEYLRYAFKEICKSCNNIPKEEQSNSLILESEPNLSKEYLWGGLNGVSGYLFTDLERYELLKNKWGLRSRPLLIGARKKVSTNFVQIEIPISKSDICFGRSNYGNTFKLDGSGQIGESKIICEECGRPLYTNQTLDFFPAFKEEISFDIVFTKEWFGSYRRLVISKNFAEWMVENKYIKFNSSNLVPVKNFC